MEPVSDPLAGNLSSARRRTADDRVVKALLACVLPETPGRPNSVTQFPTVSRQCDRRPPEVVNANAIVHESLEVAGFESG
jgi:hypothetical protein